MRTCRSNNDSYNIFPCPRLNSVRVCPCLEVLQQLQCCKSGSYIKKVGKKYRQPLKHKRASKSPENLHPKRHTIFDDNIVEPLCCLLRSHSVIHSWYIRIFDFLFPSSGKHVDAPLETVSGPETDVHLLVDNFSIWAEDNWTSLNGKYYCY
jgi:hypothetical protein